MADTHSNVQAATNPPSGCITEHTDSGNHIGVNVEYSYCYQDEFGGVCNFYIEAGNVFGVSYAKVMEANSGSCFAQYEGRPAVTLTYLLNGTLHNDSVVDQNSPLLGTWVQATGPAGSALFAASFQVMTTGWSRGDPALTYSGSPFD
jgi:hypothetical protein